MTPTDFVDVLERLHSRLSRANRPATCSALEQRNISSIVGAWFSEYRGPFTAILGDEKLITAMDEALESVLNLAVKNCARRTVLRALKSAVRYFKTSILVPLVRAYWSRAPEITPAGRDETVANRLLLMDKGLADSYKQAVLDIQSTNRLSYRGPAAELREILTAVLHTLAPNELVQATDWYREARHSGVRTESTPTRAERVKFILRDKLKGAVVIEGAQPYMAMVEDRLSAVVTATFRRGNAATHAGAERDEMSALLPYLNALLRELLPESDGAPLLG